MLWNVITDYWWIPDDDSTFGVFFFQHDDRDGEKTWIDNRGRGRGAFPARRGRFVYRKGGSSPKWTHDMFQGGDDGGLGDEDLDRKEAKNADDASTLK